MASAGTSSTSNREMITFMAIISFVLVIVKFWPTIWQAILHTAVIVWNFLDPPPGAWM